MGAGGISISTGGLALIDMLITSNGGPGVSVTSGGTAAGLYGTLLLSLALAGAGLRSRRRVRSS